MEKHIKLNREQLKKLLEGSSQIDCFLLTGIGRSSKTFIKAEDGFLVVHEIDGTSTFFKGIEQMMKSKKTNIPEALDKGAFYLYEYEAEKFEKI